jgi:hypothetical protein
VALGKPAGGREAMVAGRKAGVGYGRAASRRQRVCPENFQMETVHIVGEGEGKKTAITNFFNLSVNRRTYPTMPHKPCRVCLTVNR